MTRTLSFREWVAEYKPIEFNLDYYVNRNWSKFNFVKKYFVNFDKAREFPVNHVGIQYESKIQRIQHNTQLSSFYFIAGSYSIFFVTKKPRYKDNELIEVKFRNAKFEIFYPFI